MTVAATSPEYPILTRMSICYSFLSFCINRIQYNVTNDFITPSVPDRAPLSGEQLNSVGILSSRIQTFNLGVLLDWLFRMFTHRRQQRQTEELILILDQQRLLRSRGDRHPPL